MTEGKDANGMTLLPSHEAFEAMLRPRRPTEDGFFGTYEPWLVVCFSATWCGPCKCLDKKAIVSATPAVKWYACDIDENNYTLPYCSLKSIPSFALIKDGTFVDTKSGASGADEVLTWLKSKGVPIAQ
jgi:thioredoxin-like negative regulator of GroEL